MNSSNQDATKNGPVRTDPTTFYDVIGQDRAVEKVREWQTRVDRRGALLLFGPDGVGKRTLAQLLAKAIFCKSPLPDGSPCGACHACRTSDEGRADIGHASFDAADNKSEQSLRQFVAVSRGRSLADKQVIIVDNVDRFQPKQSDIFLETLEAPPADTTFILLATKMKRVRPAVRSRCSLHIVLRALTKRQSHEVAVQLASRFQVELDEDVLSLVSLLSQGIPARAANALRTLSETNSTTIDEALIALELDWPNKMISCWRAVLDKHESDAALPTFATEAPKESMRQLRALVNHLFAHEITSPKREVVLDPALMYLDEAAWKALLLRFDELAAAKSMKRSEMWRIIAMKCLSSDHEHAMEAMIAATAALRGASKAK